jgi:hypothetical protein
MRIGDAVIVIDSPLGQTPSLASYDFDGCRAPRPSARRRKFKIHSRMIFPKTDSHFSALAHGASVGIVR